LNEKELRRSRGATIRTRLALAFTVFVVMLVCMAGVGAWRLQELDQATGELAAVHLRMERLVGEWLSLTRSNSVRAIVLTHSDDPDLQRLFAPEMTATSKRINEIQKEVETLLVDADARTFFARIGEARQAYLNVRKTVLDTRKAGDAARANELLERGMLPALATYVDAIGKLSEHYTQQVGHDAHAAHESATWGRTVLAAFCAAGLALAFAFWSIIMRSIARPIEQAVRTAERVAAGDLSVDIRADRHDELGQLLRALGTMTARLRELVSEVATGARTVAEGSAQIAQGNVDLSQRTEEQATTLEETASSMEELTSTVAQNAGNALAASQLAASASEVARKGGQVVGRVVDTMKGISASSDRIADIIGVIDGIAFQTNLLALNAAVEAARAGDQGRGFAVVAAEVRNLAQRSAQAAKEIKTLIQDSVGQVEAGAALVDSAGRTMEEIVGQVTKVSELVAEIAAANQEQSAGIGQVNTAITHMDQAVQQNAALVEEATAATESMKAQAASLLQMVSRFHLGTAAAAPVEPLPPAVLQAGDGLHPIRYLPAAATA
jgi:methyl-accepting chemotaxis protein